MKYTYNICGYYRIDNGEQKHFDMDIDAEDNVQAMEMVIGKLVLNIENHGHDFHLDCIHYEAY